MKVNFQVLKWNDSQVSTSKSIYPLQLSRPLILILWGNTMHMSMCKGVQNQCWYVIISKWYYKGIYNEDFAFFLIQVWYEYLIACLFSKHFGSKQNHWLVIVIFWYHWVSRTRILSFLIPTSYIWVFGIIYVFDTIWVYTQCKHLHT